MTFQREWNPYPFFSPEMEALNPRRREIGDHVQWRDENGVPCQGRITFLGNNTALIRPANGLEVQVYQSALCSA